MKILEPLTATLSLMLDFVVVGGGIVGAATAFLYLERFPGRSALLLEKEREPAQHQSGHNSGVMHSGLVYAPGSSKAELCRRGKQRLEEHCREFGVPFERCGKLIIATRERELPRLADLRERALKNGVQVHSLDASSISRVEPAARGLAALHVPETGIVDYGEVTRSFLERFTSAGGSLRTAAKVRRIQDVGEGARLEVEGDQESLQARAVVVCAGLQADRIALRSGCDPGIRIVPFLGEYRRLKAPQRELIRGMIYPLADPRFPFLGVHLTRRIDGHVDCGPNALPTFAREGYHKLAFDGGDFASLASWPGTWRLALRHAPLACGELWRSLSKGALARELARLCPDLRASWLEPGPAGVRAQALTRNGTLLDDFVLRRSGPVVHLLNAPSPAATSSLAIAEELLKLSIQNWG